MHWQLWVGADATPPAVSREEAALQFAVAARVPPAQMWEVVEVHQDDEPDEFWDAFDKAAM